MGTPSPCCTKTPRGKTTSSIGCIKREKKEAAGFFRARQCQGSLWRLLLTSTCSSTFL